MEQVGRKVHTSAFERTVSAMVTQGYRVVHMAVEDNYVYLVFEKALDNRLTFA